MVYMVLVVLKGVVLSMDVFVDGWYYGCNLININFEKWELCFGELLVVL